MDGIITELKKAGVCRDIEFTKSDPVCRQGEFDYHLDHDQIVKLYQVGIITDETFEQKHSGLSHPFQWVQIPSWHLETAKETLHIGKKICHECNSWQKDSFFDGICWECWQKANL